MENIEDPGCRDALAILQDVLQLCELLRGNSESCSFNSRNCSDCFTGIAMQHLCAPDPDKSLPRQALLPMIGERLLKAILASNGPDSDVSRRPEPLAVTSTAATGSLE